MVSNKEYLIVYGSIFFLFFPVVFVWAFSGYFYDYFYKKGKKTKAHYFVLFINISVLIIHSILSYLFVLTKDWSLFIIFPLILIFAGYFLAISYFIAQLTKSQKN